MDANSIYQLFGLLGLDGTHALIYVTLLWAISEILGAIPSIKANGVFSLVFNFIKSIYTTLTTKKTEDTK